MVVAHVDKVIGKEVNSSMAGSRRCLFQAVGIKTCLGEEFCEGWQHKEYLNLTVKNVQTARKMEKVTACQAPVVRSV